MAKKPIFIGRVTSVLNKSSRSRDITKLFISTQTRGFDLSDELNGALDVRVVNCNNEQSTTIDYIHAHVTNDTKHTREGK